MWLGPRGSDGDDEELREGRWVRLRRMVDSFMMTVCLSLLKGLRLPTKETLRRGEGEGEMFLGLRSMITGSGEKLSHLYPRRRSDMQRGPAVRGR
jgi:hypothetical protein